ncbi:hypothetical protein BDQ17DRAFT_1435118 [Cyathus striatus]|nr:hypothetical protein BDQ17DRAFT_1435118 [Cyathus striatus]
MSNSATTHISFPSGPIFPPELIEHIVDFAYHILDFNEIKNISLSNTTFLYCVRKHPMFLHKLHISSWSKVAEFKSCSTQATSFQRKFIQNIKKLTISNTYKEDGGGEFIDLSSDLLLDGTFPNVEELTILGLDRILAKATGPRSLGWSPIIGKLTFPEQTFKLSLSNLNIPYKTLIHALTIAKESSLYDVQCYNEVEASILPSKLEKLELGPECAKSIANILPWQPNCFKTLKHLTVVDFSPRSHWESTATILNHLKGTLEHLQILFDNDYSDFHFFEHWAPIMPMRFANLKTMSIELKHGLELESRPDLYEYIFTIVNNVLTIHQELDVTVHLNIQDRRLDLNGKFLGSGWNTSDLIAILKGTYPGWVI